MEIHYNYFALEGNKSRVLFWRPEFESQHSRGGSQVCNSSLMRGTSLFWPLWALQAYDIATSMQAEHLYTNPTHKIKINLLKKKLRTFIKAFYLRVSLLLFILLLLLLLLLRLFWCYWFVISVMAALISIFIIIVVVV